MDGILDFTDRNLQKTFRKTQHFRIQSKNNFISDAQQSIFFLLHASLQSGHVSLRVSSTDEVDSVCVGGVVLILLNQNTVY